MQLKKTLGAALIGALVATPLSSVAFNDVQAQEAVKQESLETLVWTLAKTAPQFKLETIQTTCQITNERRTAEEPLRSELRNGLFYTGNTSLYRFKDGKAILYFGSVVVNPILQAENIGKATADLIIERNHFPKGANVEAVIKAKDTLEVNLADLELKTGSYYIEWSYLEIETDNYDKLNPTQRALAERVYCQGEDFKANMALLSDVGIKTTRIYVLNPEYVEEKAAYKAIARASWLLDFDGDSDFGAVGRLVFNHFGLRGVKVDAGKNGNAYK